MASGGCGGQLQGDLGVTPGNKGLVFQAGFRVTQIGIKKLDFCEVCQAELWNHVHAGNLPGSREPVGRAHSTIP